RHRREAAETHFLQLAAAAEQERPPLRAALIDDEIEAAAVGVPARLRQRCDRACIQPVHLSGHGSTLTFTLTANADFGERLQTSMTGYLEKTNEISLIYGC